MRARIRGPMDRRPEPVGQRELRAKVRGPMERRPARRTSKIEGQNQRGNG